MSNLIKNNKPKLNRNEKSGVYKLECVDCPKVYIGQSGRAFKHRIAEHKKSFVNELCNSNYANHLISENHHFNDDYKILHIEQKGRKLNFLEALEINKLKFSGNLLNDQTDLNNSPLLNLSIGFHRTND